MDMVYTPTYVAADMSSASIDLLVTVIVGLVAFGSIIAIVYIAGYFKKKSKGIIK